jgi:hypothetical protein
MGADGSTISGNGRERGGTLSRAIALVKAATGPV